MAITVSTAAPKRLLRRIREAIDDGTIDKWEYDDDGDFTYINPRWSGRAWLSPSIAEGGVVFNIVAPVGKPVSVGVYAVYHARFIELLLERFDGLFRFARVSSTAVDDDTIM